MVSSLVVTEFTSKTDILILVWHALGNFKNKKKSSRTKKKKKAGGRVRPQIYPEKLEEA